MDSETLPPPDGTRTSDLEATLERRSGCKAGLTHGNLCTLPSVLKSATFVAGMRTWRGLTNR